MIGCFILFLVNNIDFEIEVIQEKRLVHFLLL